MVEILNFERLDFFRGFINVFVNALKGVRMKFRVRTYAILVLVVGTTTFSMQRPASALTEEAGIKPGKVVFAGVRSSSYGIEPFPDPSSWKKAIDAMTAYFKASSPCAIWIVGVMAETPKFTHLEFPNEGKTYPNIEFEDADKHEPYLSYFDQAGIKVFLQVEPANADMITLIDLVLGRYKKHPCVIGFGVDVEWNKEADNPEWGVKVDDATAEQWETRVKSHNPKYRVFLKHWDIGWMPPTYRGDIIFVDDGQEFKNFEEMLDTFPNVWAKTFYPNTVFFQVGYDSDKPWWSKLPTPPKTIGDALKKKIPQDLGIIWVDFSLREVLPLSEQ
jgi:hypothetical protein